MQIKLTPEILLSAYSQGLFPMADNAEGSDINWVCPELRGVLPIADMHIPKSLLKTLRQGRVGGNSYEIKINSSFTKVIKLCAQSSSDRQETWINQQIIDSYTELHKFGYAHCVECWVGDEIVGGLYGISIGGAFFGESMFSRMRDASKVCLVHLVARLWCLGFDVLDAQFTNDHLTQFGIYEVAHDDYMNNLEAAICKETHFCGDDMPSNDYLNKYFEFRNFSPTR